MPFFGSGSTGGGFIGNAPFNPLAYAPIRLYHTYAPENTLTSGKISTFYDLSGNGAHITQSTDANRSTLTSGSGIGFGTRNAGLFGGTVRYTQATGMPTGDYTKMVIYKPTALTDFNNLLGGSTGHTIWYNQTKRLRMLHGGDFVTSTRLSHVDQPEIIFATYNATTNSGTLRQNGVTTGTGTAGSDNTSATYQLGSYAGSNAMVGYAYAFAIYNKVLTTQEMEYLERGYDSYLGTGCIRAINKHIVADGDSMTVGYGTITNWVDELYYLYGSVPNIRMTNDGTNGQRWDQITTQAASTIHAATYTTGAEVILIGFGGINDILQGASAATTYSRAQDWLTAAVNSGKYTDIYIATLPPIEATATTTKVFDYNQLLRDNLATLQAAGLTDIVDINTNTNFDSDGDYNNATYFQPGDKVHFTVSGQQLFAQLVYNKLTA